MIINSIDQLPDKIKSALQKRKKLKGDFIFSFKTSFNPSNGMPFLWFTLLSDGIIFLTSHKEASVYKELVHLEINCIRFRCSGYSENFIDIVNSNIDKEDFSFSISKQVDILTIKKILKSYDFTIESE